MACRYLLIRIRPEGTPTDSSEAERLLALARLPSYQGREVECLVAGGSMSVTLPPATRIRVRLAGGKAPAPGEIVAFIAGRHVVAHRVLRRGKGRRARGHLVTGGDATLLPDPPVSIATVLGPVTAVLSDGSWSSPRVSTRPALARRAARATLVALVAGVMEISVSLASALATGLIRARRRP